MLLVMKFSARPTDPVTIETAGKLLHCTRPWSYFRHYCAGLPERRFTGSLPYTQLRAGDLCTAMTSEISVPCGDRYRTSDRCRSRSALRAVQRSEYLATYNSGPPINRTFTGQDAGAISPSIIDTAISYWLLNRYIVQILNQGMFCITGTHPHT
jgi:hypothetical protein